MSKRHKLKGSGILPDRYIQLMFVIDPNFDVHVGHQMHRCITEHCTLCSTA